MNTNPQEKKTKEKIRKVAFAEHPLIEAIIKQLYRFTEDEQALRRMEQLRDNFEISSSQDTEHGPEVKLWIKGFALSDDDNKKGYLGHFAKVHPRKVAEGYIILHAEKEEVPLERHPQKQRPKQKHPNWGHPILRGIEKHKSYDQLIEAQAELDKLHREFPDTSIPNVNKLHILVYSKDPNGGGNPTKKITLEIKSTAQGKFEILSRENTSQKKAPKKVHIPISPAISGNALPDGVQAVQGRFTAMVELKKKKKRP